jgi:hypothetical protein
MESQVTDGGALLFGSLVAMAGALVFVVRELVKTRTSSLAADAEKLSDLVAANGRHFDALIAANTASVQALRDSVEAFQRREEADREVHERLIRAQEGILRRLESIEARLGQREAR